MIKPLISSIVVAVNSSDASIFAVKHAILLAIEHTCRLTAVFVVDEAAVRQLKMSKILLKEESIDYENDLEATGKRYLSYVKELADARDIPVKLDLRKGAICTEILAAADETEADLIILGAWEKNKNPRDIIKASHREIIINAKCSVLLTREPLIDLIFSQA